MCTLQAKMLCSELLAVKRLAFVTLHNMLIIIIDNIPRMTCYCDYFWSCVLYWASFGVQSSQV